MRNHEGDLTGDPLGDTRKIKENLNQTMVIDWTDELVGWINSPDFNLEIVLEENETNSIFLSTGDPEFAIHAIMEIAMKMGWEVFDHQADQFINRESLEYEEFDPGDEQDCEEEDDEEYTETIRRPQIIKIEYISE